GRVSRLAGGKRLREDVADFIGPTPVVLDDRVREMAHGLNLLLIAPAPTRPTTLGPSGGFAAVLQWGLMARGRRTRQSIILRDLLLRPLPATANAPGPTATFNVSACRKSETS